MTLTKLMQLASEGDCAAINILDMIDADECGAKTATEQQWQEWYDAVCNNNYERYDDR